MEHEIKIPWKFVYSISEKYIVFISTFKEQYELLKNKGQFYTNVFTTVNPIVCFPTEITFIDSTTVSVSSITTPLYFKFNNTRHYSEWKLKYK